MQVRCRWRRKEGRVGWSDGPVVRALAALAKDLGVAPAAAVSGLSTVPGRPDTLLSLVCTPYSMASLTSAFFIPKRSSVSRQLGLPAWSQELHCPQLGTLWSPVPHCTNSKTTAGPREEGFVQTTETQRAEKTTTLQQYPTPTHASAPRSRPLCQAVTVL